MARFAAAVRRGESPSLDSASLRRAGIVIAVLAGIAAWAAGLLGPAPSEAVLPLSDWLGAALAWFSGTFRGFFRTASIIMAWPVEAIRAVLLRTPWLTLILFGAGTGVLAGGMSLATFCMAALAYIVVTGLWEPTAVTLALVAVAVPLSAFVGVVLGLLAFRSPAFWRVLEPALDLMQTIPTLAYLLPVLALFGIGPMVGVVASTIYAVPPMVRAVVHGLGRVPADIVESGVMSGSSRNQLLTWVLIPSAMPTILLGLNQTIMAGLSMVVIASMVGGVSDIGTEVYQTMKQAKFGASILSGFVIVAIAMVLDRLSKGLAHAGRSRLGMRRRLAVGLFGAALAAAVAAAFVPEFGAYPAGWVVHPSALLDSALQWFTRVAFPVTSALKTFCVYFVLLPLKIGLSRTIRPNIWGFSMSDTVAYTYSLLAAAACLLALSVSRGAFFSVAALAVYYYFGATGVPWLLTTALVTALGLRAGGWRVGLLALAGLAFIVMTGTWQRAMISLQISAVGVAISVLLGTAIGVWSATSDRVSSVVRPICDTLQTMPIFVFLIPAVMVFLVGEFTALVAIVLYAIVPPVRYGELGIRKVPAEITEAARMMGVTKWQMLWQVQLPVALPELALGLNQTIMMALGMVVIASLVGAPGLGQDVMVALSHADPGAGLVAGLCVAVLAIIFDRILQAWSARRKRALGLA